MLKSLFDTYKEQFPQISLLQNGLVESYTNLKEEALAFHNSAFVYDGSHCSIFKVTGKDVLDFFNRISTNELLSLEEFALKSTLLLSEKGRILDKIKFLRFKDYFYIIGSPFNEERIYRWIERYIIMDDVKLENLKDKILYLKLGGSKVESFTALLFNDQIKDAEAEKIYKYFGNTFNCYVFKTNVFEHSSGYEIICEIENASELLKYFYTNSDMFETKFIGEKAFNITRIEQGEPISPNELNDSINPHEVNFLRHINSTKGCYIGQEVVARLETYDKVQKSLRGFIFNGELPQAEVPIYFQENEVGKLTSSTYSHKLKRNIGLGFISKKVHLVHNGDKLNFLNDNGEKIYLDISDLPFIRL